MQNKIQPLRDLISGLLLGISIPQILAGFLLLENQYTANNLTPTFLVGVKLFVILTSIYEYDILFT